MTSNILERLKEGTSDAHRQIEDNDYARSMMDKTMTLEQYTHYLALFYGFLKPLEQKAIQSGLTAQTGLNMELRSKTQWLEQDLLHLGMNHEQIEALPLCSQLPDLSTAARLIGSFYVIEGSTLGGQVITKQLMKFLPVEPNAGISYFNGYGTHTRDRWLTFRELVVANSESEEQREQMVHAASETFTLLDSWINH